MFQSRLRAFIEISVANRIWRIDLTLRQNQWHIMGQKWHIMAPAAARRARSRQDTRYRASRYVTGLFPPLAWSCRPAKAGTALRRPCQASASIAAPVKDLRLAPGSMPIAGRGGRGAWLDDVAEFVVPLAVSARNGRLSGRDGLVPAAAGTRPASGTPVAGSPQPGSARRPLALPFKPNRREGCKPAYEAGHEQEPRTGQRFGWCGRR